ncbi:HAMP domain-containing histidine kinase [Levilactobacillus zymae]|uniref:HAMP domain-containing histidine kinase n=2 Tax=Levilactobacillus zymae TaxID=267363 RepID=UPI00070D482B|nr:HAMP domain-containing histidine kinase [Levilactobacillus zymae]QFR61152.1 hypothetical protein LZ395_06310 [Levilactobacillus zymae]
MKKVIQIPSIDDSIEGYQVLVKLNGRCHDILGMDIDEPSKDINVSFNFERCQVLKQNGVSYLGAISYVFAQQGYHVFYEIGSLNAQVFETLSQDGFLGSNFKKYHSMMSVDSNHIKFNHFIGSTEDRSVNDKIQTYITKEWLAKANIHFSEPLRQDITARLYELFANALEHSKSPIGCIASGQSESHDIDLCVVDLGVGIVQNVQQYYKKIGQKISSEEAIRKAFIDGFTTRGDESGGLGLALIKEFLQLNKGSLDVYCNDIHLRIDPQHVNPVVHSLKEHFYGTMLNVKLKKDNRS